MRNTKHNNTSPKGELACSKDSFVVNQTLFFKPSFAEKVSPSQSGETLAARQP
jgi:hypothetical protein